MRVVQPRGLFMVATEKKQEPLTRTQWAAVRRLAKRAFDSMGAETRHEIADEMVWGSYDWQDFFDEKPPRGFNTVLFELIQQWEEVSGG